MGNFDLQRRKGRISATKRTSDLAAIRACVVPSKTASLEDLVNTTQPGDYPGQ